MKIQLDVNEWLYFAYFFFTHLQPDYMAQLEDANVLKLIFPERELISEEPGQARLGSIENKVPGRQSHRYLIKEVL